MEKLKPNAAADAECVSEIARKLGIQFHEPLHSASLRERLRVVRLISDAIERHEIVIVRDDDPLLTATPRERANLMD
jgi:hypothetical protein